MADGLRQFHGTEGAMMADFFESLVSDLDSFTLAELQAFYDMAKSITETFNNNMLNTLTAAFAAGVGEILATVLFEVGGNAAVAILQKIPIGWVFRGTQLNNMVKKVGVLGKVSKSGNHIREVVTNTPVTKAKELFNSLTKHAITKTTETNGAIIANMGNGNFITYRPISASFSNTPATISLNFNNIWSKPRQVKFLSQ